MANDDLLEEVGKLLGLAGALTRSQWRDSHRTRARSGEQLLWMAVLQTAISDWTKHITTPESLTHAKNARDIPAWTRGDGLTITLVAEALSSIFDIDDEVIKKALRKRTEAQFNPDLTPEHYYNREVAERLQVKYDPQQECYVDADGCLIYDKFGQKL